MLELLSRNWWTLVLRGIAAIVFGLLAWFYPGMTLAVLVLFFGVYVLIDGADRTVRAFSKRVPEDSRWLVGLLGALGVLIGVLTLWRPAAAAVALLLYLAAWSSGDGCAADRRRDPAAQGNSRVNSGSALRVHCRSHSRC